MRGLPPCLGCPRCSLLSSRGFSGLGCLKAKRLPYPDSAGEAVLVALQRVGGSKILGEASPGALPLQSRCGREGEPRAKDLLKES